MSNGLFETTAIDIYLIFPAPTVTGALSGYASSVELFLQAVGEARGALSPVLQIFKPPALGGREGGGGGKEGQGEAERER